MNELIDKARIYARSYRQLPYGREIEGTAELLLQMADKLEKYENTGLDPEEMEGLNFGSNQLRILNLLEEEREKHKWIPCSERLPEESLDSVIGWDAYRKRPCFVQRWDGRWILGDDVDFVHITAWQPLPEPYKTEREGQAE